MKQDRLKIWVDLAQIVSGLAVILSLVYAANQISQSQRVSSADVDTELYGRIQEMDRLVIEADGLSDILIRGREDVTSLTAAERGRFASFHHIFFDSWEYARVQWDAGILGDEDWHSWECWFVQDARRRPREGFEDNARFYFQDFVDYVHDRVRWGESAPNLDQSCAESSGAG